MLTGKKLGAALLTAIELKGVTKAEVARHFKVKPPSVQDWVKNGTISKDKLPAMWDYFAQVVGPEHWGLSRYPGQDGGPATTPAPSHDTAVENTDIAEAMTLLAHALAEVDDHGRKLVALALEGFVADPQRQLQRAIQSISAALKVPEAPTPAPTTPRATSPAKRSAASKRSADSSKLVVKVGGGQRLIFERRASLRALRGLKDEQAAGTSEGDFHEILRAIPKANG